MECDRLLKLTSLEGSELWIDCQKVAYCVAYSHDSDRNCTKLLFDGGNETVVKESIGYVTPQLKKRLH